MCGAGARWHRRARFALPIGILRGVDSQREALVADLTRLSDGHAAQDVLLWGRARAPANRRW